MDRDSGSADASRPASDHHRSSRPISPASQPSRPTRYLIVGVGAVGGTLAGQLTQSGHEVVLISRGQRREFLQETGLRLITPTEDLTIQLPVVEHPSDLGMLRDTDVLVVAVKTQDTSSALDRWASAPVDSGGVAADRIPLVTMQNGVEGPRMALRRFRQVYATCVWLPSAFDRDGIVKAYGFPRRGVLHIGRYPSGIDDFAQQIAADLSHARFHASAVADVLRWMYAKLLTNLGNVIEAVSGTIESRDGQTVLRRLQEEAETVLNAAGIPWVSVAEQMQERNGRAELVPLNGVPRAGGSSWQSLVRRTGSVETDYLNGEIVLLGRSSGVATPRNALMQTLANQFVIEGREPGSLPMTDLLLWTAAADSPGQTDC